MGGEERLRSTARPASSTRGRASTHLLDPGSFQELGTLVGGADLPADAIVMGSGRIDGRPVMVAAEDFTVKAGTISQAEQLEALPGCRDRGRRPGAARDDAGGRGLPRRRARATRGRRPTCSRRRAARAACRWSPRCSAHPPGTARSVAPMSDFAVMSEHGVDLHRRSAGGVRVARGDDHEGGPRWAVGRDRERPDPQRGARRRRLRSTWCARTSGTSRRRRGPTRPTTSTATSSPRLVPEMLDIVPRNGRRVYEMRDVIDVVFDESSSFEVQPEFGQSVVCALARLGGHPVAVVANQPRVLAGSDRRRRRRQGRALHHRRRLLPPSAGLPRRQSRCPAGQRVRAAGDPAQRRAHVRRADASPPRRSSR